MGARQTLAALHEDEAHRQKMHALYDQLDAIIGYDMTDVYTWDSEASAASISKGLPIASSQDSTHRSRGE